MKRTNTQRTADWRKANPDKSREIAKTYYAKRKQAGKDSCAVGSRKKQRILRPEESLYRSAKQRAKRSGISFSIDLADIVIPSHCPILGVTIVLDSMRHPCGPSVDRVIPALGYIKGNVQVISMQANRLKSCLDLRTLDAIRGYIIYYGPSENSS
jgi:hypothetical protein